MTAAASLLVWVLGGVMEDECLKELPGCLFLQEHNAKNKEVWATAKHSCHSQPTKRIFPKKLPYMTDTTKSLLVLYTFAGRPKSLVITGCRASDTPVQ